MKTEGCVRKRLAILDCEDAGKWNNHEQLWFKQFHSGLASWAHFRCWAGELPTLEQCHDFDAFYIGGSHYSAYEPLPWINELRSWIKLLVLSKQHATKVVGVCFGCQVAAQALGGEVGKNPSERFVLQVEDLIVSKEWQSQPYFQDAIRAHGTNAAFPLSSSEHGMDQKGKAALRVIESHGDQVLRLPAGAQLLATTPTSPLDIWGYGNRLLALQGHPEFNCPLVVEKILQPLSAIGRLSDEESAAAEANLTSVEPHSAFLRQVMMSFVDCPADHNSPDVEARKGTLCLTQPSEQEPSGVKDAAAQGVITTANASGSAIHNQPSSNGSATVAAAEAVKDHPDEADLQQLQSLKISS